MEVMADMVNNIAEMYLKSPSTIPPLSPQTVLPLRLPTPKLSAYASTSPSLFPLSPVRTSLRKNVSLSLILLMIRSQLRNVKPNWLPHLVPKLPLLSPSKFVLKLPQPMAMVIIKMTKIIY